jgi:predicted DNA-binding ribbon-helix-helix protein
MTPARRSPVIKRSVVIRGHKTSVTLEDPFWSEIRRIAGSSGSSIAALLRSIDEQRRDANLSSAIRLFVLANARARALAAGPVPADIVAGNMAPAEIEQRP